MREINNWENIKCFLKSQFCHCGGADFLYRKFCRNFLLHKKPTGQACTAAERKMPLEAASRRRKILHAGWADI